MIKPKMNDRDSFLKKQTLRFKELWTGNYKDGDMFMFKTCHNCRIDVVGAELRKGNDGSKLVTGCPGCPRSWCE